MDEICLSHDEAAALLINIDDLRAKLARGDDPRVGLCSALRIQDEHRHFLFADWPEYTGDLDFPVPAPPDTVKRPRRTRHCTAYMNHDDMFSGEYGAARLRLLDHIEAKLRALVTGWFCVNCRHRWTTPHRYTEPRCGKFFW